MVFTTKQITLDLEEYNLLVGQLETYRKKPEDGSLTKEELEEATGILLIRALQNPNLFHKSIELKDIDLGKYKAIFMNLFKKEAIPGPPQLYIRFVRT